MDIVFLLRDKIDTNKWNKCVESNIETASLSAMSWYLDVCCKDWGALIFDDYRSVIPLPCRKKYGIKYVYPPFFAPRLGVLGGKITASDLEKALHIASKYFKWIDIVFQPDMDIDISHYQYFAHRFCMLDLQISHTVLQQHYNKKHLYNCRRASEGNLTITKNMSVETIILLFTNNIGKNKNVGYKTKDYNELKDLIIFLQNKNAVEIWGVKDNNGKVCAGAFFTYGFGKYNFLFSGREQTEIQNRSMYFLFDNFIREHAQSPVYLQINGSNNEQIAHFYAGFGAKEHYAYQLTIENSNLFSKKIHSIYRKSRF